VGIYTVSLRKIEWAVGGTDIDFCAVFKSMVGSGYRELLVITAHF